MANQIKSYHKLNVGPIQNVYDYNQSIILQILHYEFEVVGVCEYLIQYVIHHVSKFKTNHLMCWPSNT